MNRRQLLLGAIIAFGATSCGPPWTVVRQATPNPLMGQKKFAVMPIDFSGLRVGEKDEPGYLAEKDAESKNSWAGDKEGMNAEYAKRLTEEASAVGISVVGGNDKAEFVVHPKVGWLEPGFYAYVAAKPSEVRMTVTISSPDGSVIDEITMSHQTGASMTNPAIGNRLRDDAEALGAWTAEYLDKRSRGEN